MSNVVINVIPKPITSGSASRKEHQIVQPGYLCHTLGNIIMQSLLFFGCKAVPEFSQAIEKIIIVRSFKRLSNKSKIF